jgi:hypothetical protein
MMQTVGAEMETDRATLVAQLNRVHEEIRAEALDFPAELRLTRPVAEEWCAMELLSHIAEMHYSYAARGDNLIANPGAPLSRPMDAADRLAGVAKGPRLTLDEALAELDAARRYAISWLAEVPPDKLVIQGHHDTHGDMTVRDVFERTIVGHARNHLSQLRETRARVERLG